MDIYLPAEFCELHDSAEVDWRDASTTRTHAYHSVALERVVIDPNSRCVDPNWLVI